MKPLLAPMLGASALPSPKAATTTAHASCVAFGRERGILIEGPSGSGKSQLALELIALGAVLVADDRTVLIGAEGKLFARAPNSIAGLIEVRGFGLLRLPPFRLAAVAAVVTLGAGAGLARLPEHLQTTRLGATLPWFRIDHGSAAFARALAHWLRRSGTRGERLDPDGIV